MLASGKYKALDLGSGRELGKEEKIKLRQGEKNPLFLFLIIFLFVFSASPSCSSFPHLWKACVYVALDRFLLKDYISQHTL